MSIISIPKLWGPKFWTKVVDGNAGRFRGVFEKDDVRAVNLSAGAFCKILSEENEALGDEGYTLESVERILYKDPSTARPAAAMTFLWFLAQDPLAAAMSNGIRQFQTDFAKVVDFHSIRVDLGAIERLAKRFCSDLAPQEVPKRTAWEDLMESELAAEEGLVPHPIEPAVGFTFQNVPLASVTQGELKKLEEKFGPKVADLARQEKIAQEATHLKLAAEAQTPLMREVKVRIPKRPVGLPFMVQQLFFLLVALYDPKSTPIEVKFEEEIIGTRMSLQFSHLAGDEIIAELAELRRLVVLEEQAASKNPAFLSKLNEKIRLNNEALNQLNSGKLHPIGSVDCVLPATSYKFYCKKENEEQLRSVIRRWRMYYSENLPSAQSLADDEEYSFQSAIRSAAFQDSKIAVKSYKDDLITSILNLRVIGHNVLLELAAKVNQLQSVATKVTEIYNLAQWPEWIQKIFNSSKSMDKAVKLARKEADKQLKVQDLTREEKAFISACARIEDAQLKPILARAHADSTATLPTIWKVAVIDSVNKSNPDEFLRQLGDGQIKVDDLYEVPIEKVKKQSFADVLKKAVPKTKPAVGANKASYFPDGLLAAWQAAEPLIPSIPAFLGECYALKPRTTLMMITEHLWDGQAGLEKSKVFRSLTDSNDVLRFMKEVFQCDWNITPSELKRLRTLIKERRLLEMARLIVKDGKQPMPDLEEVEQSVSTIPARGVKSPDGKPAQSGSTKSSPAKEKRAKSGGKKSSKSDSKPRDQTPKSGDNKKSAKDKSKQPKSGDSKSPKSKSQPKGSKKDTGTKPGDKGKKSSPAEGTKSRGRTVTIDSVEVPVAKLQAALEGAKKRGDEFVVHGDNSFGVAFLGKLISNPDVTRIQSKFDKSGKSKGRRSN